MKQIRKLALISVLLTGVNVTAYADEAPTFSASAAWVSDYIFDGVSQSNNAPAYQASAGFENASGLHAGLWMSQVDFGDATREMDWTLGQSWESGQFSGDAGITYYKYHPDSDGVEYNEVYANLTHNENATLSFFYANDYADLGFSVARYKLAYQVKMNEHWSMPIELTHWRSGAHGDERDVVPSYNHIKLGLATTLGPVAAELSYHRTDIDTGAQDLSNLDKENLVSANGNVVLSLSMGF